MARASAAILLTKLNQDNSVPARLGLNLWSACQYTKTDTVKISRPWCFLFLTTVSILNIIQIKKYEAFHSKIFTGHWSLISPPIFYHSEDEGQQVLLSLQMRDWLTMPMCHDCGQLKTVWNFGPDYNNYSLDWCFFFIWYCEYHIETITGQNGPTPKWPQVKRPQSNSFKTAPPETASTETAQTITASPYDGHAETATPKTASAIWCWPKRPQLNNTQCYVKMVESKSERPH